MQLPHNVPDFIELAEPNVFHSAKSGDWYEPATWAGGVVPPVDATVCIDAGHIVTNAYGIACKVLGIKGVLDVHDLIIQVHTILEYPGGSFRVFGNSTIIISGGPFLDNDPEEYSRGLLLMGNAVLSGYQKTPYVRVRNTILAGQANVTFESVPLEWNIGDTLAIPQTDPYVGASSYPYFKNEIHSIDSVFPGGDEVGLFIPTTYAHLPAVATDGTIVRQPHVLNLTRSVFIRSVDPANPGHVWIHGGAKVHFCHIRDMGRTTWHDASRPGRYALHVHHGAAADWQGNVITWSTAFPNETKWAAVIHDSHFGTIKNNVIFGYGAGGIVTEDGGETGNLIEGNLSCWKRASTRNDAEEKRKGIDGAGIWLKGQQNIVRDNYAYCAHGSGLLTMGNEGSVSFPEFAGQPRDQWKSAIGSTLQLLEFDGFECWASDNAFQLWKTGVAGPTANRARGIRAYNCLMGFNCYYEEFEMAVDGIEVCGARKQSGIVYGGADAPAFTVQNFFITGCDTGVYVRARGAGGISTFEDGSIFARKVGVSLENWANRPFNGQQAHAFYDVDVSAPIQYSCTKLQTKSAGLLLPFEVFVFNHQGVLGDNFRLYLLEQSPDFVIPKFEGCDPAIVGLTNAQALAAGLGCIGGEIVPAGAVKNPPGIIGYKL